MHFHPILYKSNYSVSRNFSPGNVNRHLRQIIYKTNIFNSFNDFKKFSTTFNSFVVCNFILNHNFHFNATWYDNLVIPQIILALYTKLITVLAKMKNIFVHNFDYQKLWKTAMLI